MHEQNLIGRYHSGSAANNQRPIQLYDATMPKPNLTSVDDYIASRPEPTQAILERVRKTIRAAIPAAEEVISYKMPTYKLHGIPVLNFAAWKQHYSLYAATKLVIAAFQDELAPYEIQKGTIRFPLSQPVPVKLIGRIAKFRAQEIAAREKAASKKR